MIQIPQFMSNYFRTIITMCLMLAGLSRTLLVNNKNIHAIEGSLTVSAV
jgi:hypothetical protein